MIKWPWTNNTEKVADPIPLPGDEWHDWMNLSPDGHAVVEIIRVEWAEPKVVDPRCLSPMMNVCGLYWRELP